MNIRIPLILFLAARAALPQSTGTATVVGNVSDSSGAMVASAKVAVRNLGTQFVYEGLTNAAGPYYVPNLPSNNYDVTVEATGFKHFVRPA